MTVEITAIAISVDPFSVESVSAARNTYEEQIEATLAPVVQTFIEGVIADGAAAVTAPVLLAAASLGRKVPDPFAFTNVQRRWYTAVRGLAQRREHGLSESQILDVLEGSDLPSDLFAEVSTILTTARDGAWTEYRTKRHLSKTLIPKMSSGRWDTRSRYRSAVSRIARSLATDNFGAEMERTLRAMGVEFKEWVSRHDDRVRVTHRLADGQTVRLADTFIVGAAALRRPADPRGPIGETANCRCIIVGARPTRGAGMSRNSTRGARRTGGLAQYALASAPSLFADETTTLTASAPPVEAPAPDDVDDAPVEAAPETGPLMWTGTIGMEQTMTGDGRLIEEGALRWENLPIPLRYVATDVGAHDGAQVVGSIQYIEREDDGRITATGTLDTDSDVGNEAVRHLRDRLTNGVSMDLDDVSFEVRVAEDVVNEMEPQTDGTDAVGGEHATSARAVVDGKVVMLTINSDDEVHVTKTARIRAATIVAIPAFAEASIHVVEDGDDTVSDSEAVEALDPEEDETLAGEGDPGEETFNWVDDVGGLPKYIKRIADHLQAKGMTQSHAIAAAVNTVKRWARGGSVSPNGKGPRVSPETVAKAAAAVAEWEAKKARARLASSTTTDAAAEETDALTAGGGARPDAAWFEDPRLTGPTPIRVTEDGRVYGHLATWDSCHIANADFCTTPPRSQTGYAYFHTGAVLAANGAEIAVGHLTLNTLHAPSRKRALAALAHYENTGLTAADVRAGEDAYGVWVAGAVRGSLPEEEVRALRAAPLSGDWRRVNGNLELVAALAVNVPGFPIPRPQGLVASGEMQTLVASGMMAPKRVRRPGTEGALSTDDLRYLRSLAAREKRAHVDRLARDIKERRVAEMAATLGGSK